MRVDVVLRAEIIRQTDLGQTEMGVGIGMVVVFGLLTCLFFWLSWFYYNRKKTDASAYEALPDMRLSKAARFWRKHRASFFGCLAIVMLLLTVGGIVYLVTGNPIQSNL